MDNRNMPLDVILPKVNPAEARLQALAVDLRRKNIRDNGLAIIKRDILYMFEDLDWQLAEQKQGQYAP